MRSLPPAALEPRLGRALELLVAGARDLPTRQQTLRATLDWSHDLLGEAERLLFARLAVFAGGFTLDDLEAVVGEDPALALGGLVDASLVRRRGARFTLLETIREYALERLRELGAEEDLRRRHGLHYLARAEAAAEHLSTGSDEEPLAYAFLDGEQENLWAALDWFAERGELALELRLACAQRWYLHVRGRLEEGRLVFERLRAASEHGDPALRAATLVHGGLFPYRLGDMVTAKAYFEEALALYRGLEDPEGVARCIAELGAVAVGEEDYPRADELYREAIPLFEQLAQPSRVATSLSNLAAIASIRRDLDASADYGARAIELQRELQDTDGLAISLVNAADAQLQRGEPALAEPALREALTLARQIGFREVTAYCFGIAARLLLARDEHERAARLLGAAAGLFATLGIALAAAERETFETTLASLRSRLGSARVDEELSAGEQCRPEALVDELLAELGVP